MIVGNEQTILDAIKSSVMKDSKQFFYNKSPSIGIIEFVFV
jgi:hypothetical protein